MCNKTLTMNSLLTDYKMFDMWEIFNAKFFFHTCDIIEQLQVIGANYCYTIKVIGNGGDGLIFDVCIHIHETLYILQML